MELKYFCILGRYLDSCFILIFTKKIDKNIEIIIMTSERTKRRRVKEELEAVFDVDVNDFNLEKINHNKLKAVSDNICNEPEKKKFYSPKLTTANELIDDNCFNSELIFPKVIVLLYIPNYINNF